MSNNLKITQPFYSNRKRRLNDQNNSIPQYAPFVYSENLNTNVEKRNDWQAREFHALIVHEIERQFQETFDMDISICEYPLVSIAPLHAVSFDCNQPGQCRPTSSISKSASSLVLHPQIFDKSLTGNDLYKCAALVNKQDLKKAWNVIGKGGFGDIASLPPLHNIPNGPQLVVKLQRIEDDLLSFPLIEQDLSDYAATTRFPSIIEAVTLYVLNRYEQTIWSFLPSQPDGCVPRIFYTACIRQGNVLYHAIVMEQITLARNLDDKFFELQKDYDNAGVDIVPLIANLAQFISIIKSMETCFLRVWNFDANTRNMLVKKTVDEEKSYMIDFGYVFISIPIEWICSRNAATTKFLLDNCRGNKIAFKYAMVVPWDTSSYHGAYGVTSLYVDSLDNSKPTDFIREISNKPELFGLNPKEFHYAKLTPSVFLGEHSADYNTHKLSACMAIPSPACSADFELAHDVVDLYNVQQGSPRHLYQQNVLNKKNEIHDTEESEQETKRQKIDESQENNSWSKCSIM